ncbi:MAG: hypothetical protein ABSF91_08330 [Bacteroidota bacterium]|jgi:hypothetical protein
MTGENNDHINIGELPDLRVIPVERILFHEEHDAERTCHLEAKLRKQRVLKNPPVVALDPTSGDYILLDGANRTTALRMMGVPDILVQVTDLNDPGLKIRSWHHAIEHIGKKNLINAIEKIPGITLVMADSSNPLYEEHEGILCRVRFNDNSILIVSAVSGLRERVAALRTLTAAYRGDRYMDRVSYTNPDHLRKNYRAFSGLVMFRPPAKEDLPGIVSGGLRIPSGITRIILPKRALRFNIPLEVLQCDIPTNEKNCWVRERIRALIKQKSIRFYFEPVFLFDE